MGAIVALWPLALAESRCRTYDGRCKYKKKSGLIRRTALMKGGVVPLGVEPRTHGFSVHCSTTWAKAPFCCYCFISELRVQRYTKYLVPANIFITFFFKNFHFVGNALIFKGFLFEIFLSQKWFGCSAIAIIYHLAEFVFRVCPFVIRLPPDFVTFLLRLNTFLDNQALARIFRWNRVTHTHCRSRKSYDSLVQRTYSYIDSIYPVQGRASCPPSKNVPTDMKKHHRRFEK